MYIQPVGKRSKCLLCALLCCGMLLLTGCPGLSDWIYSDLPGDYEIWKVNSTDICLNKDGKHVVERYIIAFCYNAQYIGVQRVPVDATEEAFDLQKLDTSCPEYYLVDSACNEVYGPYSGEEYQNKLSDLNVSDMCQWMTTDSNYNEG